MSYVSIVFGNGALLLAISLLNTLGFLIPFEDLQLQLPPTHFHTKHFKGLPAKSDACVLRVLSLTVLLRRSRSICILSHFRL